MNAMIDEVEDKDPEGFISDHFEQKEKRKKKRKNDRHAGDGGKRIHKVGKKEKWRWNPNEGFDE